MWFVNSEFCVLSKLKWALLVLFLDAAYRVHKLVLRERCFKMPHTPQCGFPGQQDRQTLQVRVTH